MDALEGLQALVQQEGGVVDQHVDVAHKLLARAAGQRRRRAPQGGGGAQISSSLGLHCNIPPLGPNSVL